MAKLPPIDLEALRIVDLLNAGKRDEAKARVLAILAEGRAQASTQKLAAELFSAKRGRQRYGAIHRWYEIGADNDEMRDEGVPHAERMKRLGLKYKMADESKLKLAIAKYETAKDLEREEWLP